MTFKQFLQSVAALFGPYQDPYERGKQKTRDFLAGNPGPADIRAWWSSAHNDRAFNDDGFARGAIEILRPVWEKLPKAGDADE